MVCCAAAFRMIEDQRRADFADRGRAETSRASRLQDRLFVNVVLSKMFVEIAEDGVIFDERSDAVIGVRHRKAREDRIAESLRCRRGDDRSPCPKN